MLRCITKLNGCPILFRWHSNALCVLGRLDRDLAAKLNFQWPFYAVLSLWDPWRSKGRPFWLCWIGKQEMKAKIQAQISNLCLAHSHFSPGAPGQAQPSCMETTDSVGKQIHTASFNWPAVSGQMKQACWWITYLSPKTPLLRTQH